MATLGGLILGLPIDLSGQATSPGPSSVAPESTAVISGTVVDRDDGRPMGYATVELLSTGRGTFANASGHFRLTQVPAGRFTLRARQVGYSPVDSAIDVTAGQAAEISLRLHRTPLALPAVTVAGRRSTACVATGPPDSAVNPQLAGIFAQVRVNVDRFRLLVDEYPFRYEREEIRTIESSRVEDSTVSVDTVTYESRFWRQYREGHVVFDDVDASGHRTRTMYLPTFRDFSDSAFLAAHCFTFGGVEHLGGKTAPRVLRIDFTPAKQITTPDVAGSIYLDAQRDVVRRATVHLTRAEALKPSILGLAVTTTFREVVPLVPIFDSVETDQPLGPTAMVGLGFVDRTAIERDRLLAYTFEQRRPGDESEMPTVQNGTTTLTVAVFDAQDDQPLPYATVSLGTANASRLADDSGRVRLPGVGPGTYLLHSGQIGYEPVDTTVRIDPAARTARVRLDLRRAASGQLQSSSDSRVATCDVPSQASSTKDELAPLLTQMEENADRFRLLMYGYRFHGPQEERQIVRRQGAADSVISSDTVTYESSMSHSYAFGAVVSDSWDSAGHGRRYIFIPTLADLSDSAFLSTHCFAYGGADTLGGAHRQEVLRIDFRPSSPGEAADVTGSVYLDARSYVVRRTVFRLAGGDTLTPPLPAVSTTTMFQELLPLVPIVETVESVQSLPAGEGVRTGPAGDNERVHVAARESIEEDRLLAYTFEGLVPGEQGSLGGTGGTTTQLGAGEPGGAGVRPSGAEGSVTGRVIGTDSTPVVGAFVGLFGGRDSTTTSDSGRFTLASGPDGPHMLWVHRLGFQAARVPITVSSAPSHPISITLLRSVPLLATVVTTAQTQSALKDVGFDQRKRAGQGQFLMEDQIEDRHATNMTQLLDGMRGILLFKDNHNFGTSVVGTRGAGSCVAYVIDGVPQTQLYNQDALGNPLPTDDADNLIDPSAIGAMEVYSSSERPAGLGSLQERPLPNPGQAAEKVDLNAQQCVLVVIWTRGRLGLPPSERASTPQKRADTFARGRLVSGQSCEIGPPSDTVDVAIYAALAGGRQHARSDTAWSRYLGGVLTDVRTSFVVPSDLPLAALGYPFVAQPSRANFKAALRGLVTAASPSMSTALMLTVDSAGRLAAAQMTASSLSGAADTSVLAAVMEAAEAGLPTLPSSDRSSTPTRLTLVVSTGHPAAGDTAVVLGHMSVPSWLVNRTAMLAPGAQPSLDLGDGPAVAGGDSVRLEFVVDQTGNPVKPTLRVVSPVAGNSTGATSSLVASLIRALPRFRFQPALVGTCAVPEIMAATFSWGAHTGGS